MDRRTLLQGMGAALLAGCTSGLRPAAAPSRAPDWALGWRSLTTDALAPVEARVQGRFPDALHGTLYRNGPGRMERAGQRVSHWFNGDGMVQAFGVSPRGVTHHGRFVSTFKYQHEERLGHYALGTAELPARGNDAHNTANTSVLMVGGELLALWEAGSAYRLDPETLETRGTKDWSPELTGVPFSAHPLPERDGSYWNFGLAPYADEHGLMVLYHFSADGRLLQSSHLPMPFPGYAHAFAQTERHLVVVLAPLLWEQERGVTWFDAEAWQPSLGTTVLVVEKADLTRVVRRELPAGFAFHFGHAWEDGDRLRAYACWYEDAHFMHLTLDQNVQGRVKGLQPALLAQLEIPLGAGQGRVTRSPHGAEFPVVDPRVPSRRGSAHFVTLETADPKLPHSGAIARIDVERGKVQHFDYGPGIIAEEHLFVPGGPREGQGWLLGTSLDCVRGQTRLAAFDAEHLDDGPVALATLPRALPLGFHGTFRKG
ncbi:carotenoid oxygenase family protein [Pyxidicoccus xibeiensis]|uniref:carotenoid oxygenase family protein n=1 Tax=Pyxidicoccus xibeiensis TaxID=2906759 RepID=UPI0020A6E11A|nr:carotenoid oxygenase family protein [Pyxidicoccus xibeiensis]MCP3138336.1 carotenoid oxygenase family protein [Pyxidicoccus xibeiensis]